MRGAEVVDASGGELAAGHRDALLALARGTAMAPPPEGDGAWFTPLVHVAEHHRLLGLLADEVTRSGWQLDPGATKALNDRQLVWLTNSLHVERTALAVADLFERHDIPHRFLKGVALARLVYDDPSTRPFADLDVLVPAAHLDRAVALLAERPDAEVPQPEPRPGFTRQFGKEIVVRLGRIEVDVHRTLVAGPFAATIDVADLMAGDTPFEVGGRTLHTLGPTGLILHACCHTALGDVPVRLGAVHDLLRLAERLTWSADDVAAVASRWRIDAVVQRAMRLVGELAGPADGHPLAELATLMEGPVPRRQTWLLRSYLGPARGYTRELAAVAVTPGVRARARYLRALVAPAPGYLRGRGHGGRLGHLRNGLRRLFGRRG